MPDEHSIFSPSGMDAKIKCRGSHLATLGMNNSSSPEADRGTECHDWAQYLLPAEINGLELIVPDFVADWQEECTRDMVKQAIDMYDTMSEKGLVDMELEAQVSLSGFDPPGFDMSQLWGTVDVVFWCPDSRELTIIDYKTGVGIRVNPVRNVQLMIYALGVIATTLKGDIPAKINICISQPRLEYDLQMWETNFETIKAWMDEELIPALQEMSKPGAPFTPGESQCRWCPIKGRCKAQRDEMLGLFDTAPTEKEGDESPTFSDEQIDTLMLRLPEFKQWCNQVAEAGMNVLERGDMLPHFKLVRGTSHRKWKDAVKAETYLRNQGLKDKERHTRKVLSPAQAEKVLKDKLQKKAVRTNFDKLWEKPQGKLSWAVIDDPRPGVVIDKKESLKTLADLL